MTAIRGILSFTATAVVAGSMALSGCNREENKQVGKAVENAGTAVSNGVTEAAGHVLPTGASDLTGATTLLDKTVADATKNGPKDVADNFAKEDRDRIEAALPAGNDDYTAQVSLLRDNWKAKYGSDFDLPRGSDLFSPPFATVGYGSSATDTAARAAAENNRSQATAMIPASQGMPAVKVPLVAESGMWKIDVPNSLTGDKLKANLTKALTDLNQNKSAWPSDPGAAYRAVARNVLAAVMNQS